MILLPFLKTKQQFRTKLNINEKPVENDMLLTNQNWLKVPKEKMNIQDF